MAFSLFTSYLIQCLIAYSFAADAFVGHKKSKNTDAACHNKGVYTLQRVVDRLCGMLAQSTIGCGIDAEHNQWLNKYWDTFDSKSWQVSQWTVRRDKRYNFAPRKVYTVLAEPLVICKVLALDVCSVIMCFQCVHANEVGGLTPCDRKGKLHSRDRRDARTIIIVIANRKCAVFLQRVHAGRVAARRHWNAHDFGAHISSVCGRGTTTKCKIFRQTAGRGVGRASNR